MSRWLGLAELLVDAVTHGATAIERVHREVAARPLRLVALVPPLGAPARGILAVQDGIISGVYAAVRTTARVAGGAAAVALQDRPLTPRRGGRASSARAPGAP